MSWLSPYNWPGMLPAQMPAPSGGYWPRVLGLPAPAAKKPRAKGKKKDKPKTGSKTKVNPTPLQCGDKSVSYFKKENKLSLSKKMLANISPVNLLEVSIPQRLQVVSGTQGAQSFYIADSGNFIAPSMPSSLQRMFASIDGNATKRMYLESVYVCIEYANASTMPARVSIYDLSYKQDMNVSSGSYQSPEGAWNQGEIDEGDSSGLTNIMSYPSKVVRFGKYYNILQKKDLTLTPGEVHTHKVYYSPRRFITATEVGDYTRIAGKTLAVMVAAHGTPVDPSGATDVSGASIDASGNVSYYAASTVTTSPVALNSIAKFRYSFRWLDDTDSDILVSNNIASNVASLEGVNQIGSIIAANTG